MPLDRWWRPRSRPISGKELVTELTRRRAVQGRPAPRITADALDEADACGGGCHPEGLYRVVQGPALVGSLVCRECGTVYRKD